MVVQTIQHIVQKMTKIHRGRGSEAVPGQIGAWIGIIPFRESTLV